MQTQITDPIPTIKYPTPAMFSCATEDQFPGIRINNPLLLIQQWKRNIWHYQIHLEKHLQGSNSDQELKVRSSSWPITIFSDNQSALEIAENPANYCKAKHIDIRYHAIRHYLRNDLITVDYVPTNAQAADIFTKPLGPFKHHKCLELLGLRNTYEKQ